MLTLKNLTVSIADKIILKKIDFTFEKGKVYAVMGPNGSGKSTLAAAVMGHPSYKLSRESKIIFNKKNISALDPDKRSKLGLFLSFQTPMSLSGVNIYQLMRFAMDKKTDALAARKKIQEYAKKLNISEDLLTRSLNDGFSGGEKKKMEVLQAAMLDPVLIFFDEVDTGVDVDALRAISKFLDYLKKQNKTFVLITHYNRILKHIKPDKVLIIKNGKLVKSGGAGLADTIEKEGYDKYETTKS